MAKRNLNWTEIRARYEKGEPTRSIWTDYKNCTAQMIYQKAKRDGWKKQKDKNAQEIVTEVVNELKDLLAEGATLSVKVAVNILRDLDQGKQKEWHPTLSGQAMKLLFPIINEGQSETGNNYCKLQKTV